MLAWHLHFPFLQTGAEVIFDQFFMSETLYLWEYLVSGAENSVTTLLALKTISMFQHCVGKTAKPCKPCRKHQAWFPLVAPPLRFRQLLPDDHPAHLIPFGGIEAVVAGLFEGHADLIGR